MNRFYMIVIGTKQGIFPFQAFFLLYLCLSANSSENKSIRKIADKRCRGVGDKSASYNPARDIVTVGKK